MSNNNLLRVIGIDFGTSTTYMNVKRYQNGVPLGDSANYIPVSFNFGSSKGSVDTIVRANADGSFDFGTNAEEPIAGAEIFRTFKMDLESPDEQKREQARRMTLEFFRFLHQSYAEQSKNLGSKDEDVLTMISYPVKWQQETVDFMINTAAQAGFPNVQGMDEATAALSTVMCLNLDELRICGALSAARPGYVLMVDMGAGTTDLALCRCTLPQTYNGAVNADAVDVQIVVTWPQSKDEPTFGGREIDEILSSYVEAYLNEALSEQFRSIAAGVSVMKGQAKSWKERNVSPSLRDNKAVTTCGYITAYQMFLQKPFPPLTRESFEEMIAEPLQGFTRLVTDCLDKAAQTDAGFAENGLNAVILTGGHSAWYFVRELFNGDKGGLSHPALERVRSNRDAVICLPNPQSTVALGLIYHRQLSNIKIGLPNKNDILNKILAERLRNKEPNDVNYVRTSEPPVINTPPAPQPPPPVVTPGQPLQIIPDYRPTDTQVYRLVKYFLAGCAFPENPNFRRNFTVFRSNPRLIATILGKPYFSTHTCDDICFAECDIAYSDNNPNYFEGFAFCPYGVYYGRFFSSGCISWEAFLTSRISTSGLVFDKVNIGSVKIPVAVGTVNDCKQFLTDLQQYLNARLR